MVRALHTGDWHLTEGPRFADTLGCLEFLVADGIKSGVALWLNGGDQTGTTVPHRATTLERNTLGMLRHRQADHAPDVEEYGNHDSEGDLELCSQGEVRPRHPIYIVDRPRIVEAGGAVVYVLPYIWKRHFLETPGGTIAEQNHRVEQTIREMFFAPWKKDAVTRRAAGIPTILQYHGTVRGCLLAGGEVMAAGQEIEFTVEELEGLGFDYIACSHIHLCQQMGPRTWYAGSPDRSNFGESDEKGFLVVDIEAGELPLVHRRLSPARRFVTLEAKWDAKASAFVYSDPALLAQVKGAEVRTFVEMAEDEVGGCPLDALEKELHALGATVVKTPERRMIPTVRVRCEAIAGVATPAERLAVYWDSRGDAGPSPEQRARRLAKLGRLEIEAEAIR